MQPGIELDATNKIQTVLACEWSCLFKSIESIVISYGKRGETDSRRQRNQLVGTQ